MGEGNLYRVIFFLIERMYSVEFNHIIEIIANKEIDMSGNKENLATKIKNHFLLLIDEKNRNRVKVMLFKLKKKSPFIRTIIFLKSFD